MPPVAVDCPPTRPRPSSALLPGPVPRQPPPGEHEQSQSATPSAGGEQLAPHPGSPAGDIPASLVFSMDPGSAGLRLTGGSRWRGQDTPRAWLGQQPWGAPRTAAPDSSSALSMRQRDTGTGADTTPQTGHAQAPKLCCRPVHKEAGPLQSGCSPRLSLNQGQQRRHRSFWDRRSTVGTCSELAVHSRARTGQVTPGKPLDWPRHHRPWEEKASWKDGPSRIPNQWPAHPGRGSENPFIWAEAPRPLFGTDLPSGDQGTYT